MSGFRGVRMSKFRHIFGHGSRRENCYEGIRLSTGATDSLLVAANPKFLAVILEVAGGGAFQVVPLKWAGRVDYHVGRITGHVGPVTDLKWDPFNDNVIASASDDGSVKLWYVPDEGVEKQGGAQSVCELLGHTRRVVLLEWHPTAENVLASAGFDFKVFIWNVKYGEILSEITCHEDVIWSISFSRLGNYLATTCKDRVLRVVDPRSGDVLQDKMLMVMEHEEHQQVHHKEAWAHEGAKASKVVCVSYDRLLTTGFSRSSSRQFALWDANDLATPLVLTEIDFSSGVLHPFFDYDTNLLFIAGKGDGNIRFYELTDSQPYVHYLSEFQSTKPQRGLCQMPKRGLAVAQCEIYRFYKLHAIQLLVEPISFTVPRKAETFQKDLYPLTPGPTPALTAEEWFNGMDKEPVLISLRAGTISMTYKPVTLKQGFDQSEKPALVTSDFNNERKFQFLSQITRADYRNVKERDDYSELIRHDHLREKVYQQKIQKERSVIPDTRSAQSDSPPFSPLPSTDAAAALPGRFSVSSADEISNRVSGTSSHSKDGVGAVRGGTVQPEQQRTCSYSNPSSARVSPRARSKHSKTSSTNHVATVSENGSGDNVEPSESPTTTDELGDDASHSQKLTSPGQSSSGTIELHAVSEGGINIDESKSIPCQPHQQNGQLSSRPEVVQFRAKGIRQGSSSSSVRAGSGAVGSPPQSRRSFEYSTHVQQVTKQLPQYPMLPARQRSEAQLIKTKPGRIVAGPLFRENSNPLIRPSYLYNKRAGSVPVSAGGTENGSSNVNDSRRSFQPGVRQSSVASSKPPMSPPSASESSPSKRESELQRMYTSQCKQLRIMMEESEMKQRRVEQLEKDLIRFTAQNDKYEVSRVVDQEEIDSLRHEIQWKDNRIQELQNQVYELMGHTTKR